MIIKAYRERQYYLSKYGEKNYIDNDDSGVYVAAAMLTGRGLRTEEEHIYTAVGETEEEAQKSLSLYLTTIDYSGDIITRVCTCKELSKRRALCPVCDEEEFNKTRVDASKLKSPKI